MQVPDATPGRSSDHPQWFATTHWSVVLAAKQADSTAAAVALEKLCRTYWPPIYAYVRREGRSLEDAQDLTQEFLSRLVHKEWLNHLHDRRGKFRSFLLTFLKHFLSDEREKAATLKRGGGKTFISLDGLSAEERNVIEPSSGLSPEELFQRRWAETILEHAAKRLGEEYATPNQAAMFDRLKDFQPGRHGALTYAEVGAPLGLSESAIKSAVHRLRLRHREILRDEIAQTVSCPEEVDEEIRYLLAIVST